MQQKKFTIFDTQLFNILINISYQPDKFHECIKSILAQTYKNYRIIVSYSDERCKQFLNEYELNEYIYIYKSYQDYTQSQNIYINEILSKVNEGWIIFLNENDIFTHNMVFHKLRHNMQNNNNNILYWKVKQSDNILYPKNIGNLNSTEITNSGYCFHYSYTEHPFWNGTLYNGTNFIVSLLKQRILQYVFIDMVLVQSIITNKKTHKNNSREDTRARYINIVISGDRMAYTGICALINSILLNCKNPMLLKIYIVCESRSILNEMLTNNCYLPYFTYEDRIDFDSNSIIKLIQPDNSIIENIKETQSFWGINGNYINKKHDWGKPISTYNYIRFYFYLLLPESVNKVIYLDTDMIVKGDIEELYNIKDEIHNLAGVFCERPYKLQAKTWISSTYLELFSNKYVWNAGMYVTYLDKWREKGYGEQCIALVQSNKLNKFYIGGTQVPMNIVFSNTTQKLEQKWNQTGLGERKRPVSIEFEQDIDDAKILHWTGNNKPWLLKKDALFESFGEEWYIYFNKNNEDLAELNKNKMLVFSNKIKMAQNLINEKVNILHKKLKLLH